MNSPAEKPPLQVGFTDALRSSAGVLLPAFLLTAALLTTAAELAGIPFALSAPVTLTCGVVIVAIVEGLRRYVLATRPSGRGQHAVGMFRGVIWLLLWGAVPVAALAIADASIHCFRQACGDTDRIMSIATVVWSLIALALLPMGYRLLTLAEWLRSRAA